MPLGILNKTLIINGVSVTTEELRNSLLDRNLPPPIPNEVQEGNYQTFYEDIGQLFSLPNPLIPETVQIDEDALQDNGEDRRTVNLSQNKYQDSDGIVPYQVVDLIINPNIVVIAVKRTGLSLAFPAVLTRSSAIFLSIISSFERFKSIFFLSKSNCV